MRACSPPPVCASPDLTCMDACMRAGMAFKNLKLLKLRYPNSHDLVRIAQWSTLQRLDIKFTEHEREWHQEDACQELIDVVPRLPPSPGVEVITSVRDARRRTPRAAATTCHAMSFCVRFHAAARGPSESTERAPSQTVSMCTAIPISKCRPKGDSLGSAHAPCVDLH